ncbi:MAG: PaaI family thioesterase [Bacteroidales bacterium]|nr:PaaI family thioesterase [Bacteroidales bacterium]
MKKLNNPFTKSHNFNCFGCAPHNEFGMQLEFSLKGDEVISEWEVPQHFEGWVGVLHGGIIAALIDEIAGWYVFSVLGVAGMTTNLNIRYLKPIETRKGKIKIVARLKQQKRQLQFIEVEVFDSGKQLAAKAEVCYYTFSEKDSEEKFNFPGKDAFYE